MKKQVKEMSLQRAKELLGLREIDEKKLVKLLERVKAFCRVSYQLYIKKLEPDNTAVVKTLNVEPPEEFTKAA